jgi:hypothetical protein
MLARLAVNSRPAHGPEDFLTGIRGPLNGPMTKGEQAMNDQNRVLARKGARDVTEQEVEQVCGGIRTATKCSLTAAGTLDGDLHECS